MYGLIIKNLKNQYFTNLKEVFDVLGSAVEEYNWLLSDYDCNIYPSDKIPINKPFVWLDGAKFIDIVEKYKIQFIWGVVTAYVKDIALKDILKYSLPYAEEYTGFWQTPITMQNPLADIEIVSLDSTYLLVISKLPEVIEKFLKEYPDSTDLAEHNSKLL